jgi:hypothetical protein
MNLLKKLTTLLTVSTQSGGRWYPFAVQCNRCGEIIRTQINLSNDPSAEYDEAGRLTGYVCRKVLVGHQNCFRPIEVTLTFDANRRLLDREIADGKFVEE